MLAMFGCCVFMTVWLLVPWRVLVWAMGFVCVFGGYGIGTAWYWFGLHDCRFSGCVGLFGVWLMWVVLFCGGLVFGVGVNCLFRWVDVGCCLLLVVVGCCFLGCLLVVIALIVLFVILFDLFYVC